MPAWLKRVRTLFRRGAMERELDAELEFHLDMLAAEYVRQGVAPDAARRSARQLFGGVDSIKDDVRDAWLTRLVETVTQDVRYGLRGLRKQAGYALAVIVTMALGIGANTAIFSVVNAVVLQPLPYARGERLCCCQADAAPASTTPDSRCSTSTTSARQRQPSTPSSNTTTCTSSCSAATSRSGWRQASCRGTTSTRWASSRALGRTFRAADDAHDAPAALILSHEYWQRAFGGDLTFSGASSR